MNLYVIAEGVVVLWLVCSLPDQVVWVEALAQEHCVESVSKTLLTLSHNA